MTTANKKQQFTVSEIVKDVKINIEQLEKRQCKLHAKITIPYSWSQVWQVITDYENFANFIPSLTKSKQIAHPQGGIRLEQLRQKSLMGVKFSARSVFDIKEYSNGDIYYQLVEGDFQRFDGYWRLQPKDDSLNSVALIYDFDIVPKRIFPVKLVEHFLREDVPNDLLSVRQQVERVFSV